MNKFLPMFLLFLVAGTAAWSQADSVRTVTGKVTSSDDGTGLPGVNVIVEGTTKGTSTDAEGNYSISVGPSENALSYSFVGYESVTQQVGDRTTIDVVLEPEATSLEEVVVIGYGEARKSDLTGAVASVQGSDLELVP